VQELQPNCFAGVKLALFSAGGTVSSEWVPQATAAGCVVVDNSSFFRMHANVPLVVPEINGQDIAQAFNSNNSNNRASLIIANPNCTTAITLMALYPLHKRFQVRRVFASSYQAVSGTGAQAIVELRDQVSLLAADKPIRKPQVSNLHFRNKSCLHIQFPSLGLQTSDCF
jgi:aspartate-semialdehyde dehydrogenase